MRKLVTLALAAVLSLNIAYAEETPASNEQANTEMVDDSTKNDSTAKAEEVAPAPEAPAAPAAPVQEAEQTFSEVLKEKFIEGGWEFMAIVCGCLIFGLAFAFERIITLNLGEVNTTKFINDVEGALENGGIEGAKELCKNTRGPIASIYFQGLDRAKEGLDIVEKTIVSYGSVQMGQLEKGLVWVSLFIALAPMLGFMGTVIGMIDAFDQIQAAGDIQPSMVAGGIKVALLTTLAGLIVAIILQIFYNYIVSKIDAIVNEMEDASIQLVDMLIEHNKK